MIEPSGNGRPVSGALQPEFKVTLSKLAPQADWSTIRQSGHFAQFYETDSFLMSSLHGYVRAGLEAHEAVVVVATAPHRQRLEQLLEEDGIDVVLASASGQFVALDAAEILSKFMVDGWPDARRFSEVLGAILARAAEGRKHVRVFGEMVALLWNEGRHSAAIALEEEWNELQKLHEFSLFCGYPINGLAGEELAQPLLNVCAVHSQVIPGESYASLADPDDRLKAIIRLQQKANSLQAEIAERKRAEGELRTLKRELEMQIEDLRRLHEMSASLNSTLDVRSVLREVLRAAMAVQETDLGLLSLCDPETETLNVAVACGFDQEFLDIIKSIPAGESACGIAYHGRARVIVEDVEVDPLFESWRHAARKAGFRACHSTPLITRTGNIIGVLSVHFRTTHHPSDRETRLMDLYARMAADIIENARLHQRVQKELHEQWAAAR